MSTIFSFDANTRSFKDHVTGTLPTITESAWQTALFQALVVAPILSNEQKGFLTDLTPALLAPKLTHIVQWNPTENVSRTFAEYKTAMQPESE